MNARREGALRVHWAGLPGRARADRWALVVVTVVVGLTALLAVVTPRLVERTADQATAAAVRSAGELADTTVTVPFPDEYSGDGSAADPARDTAELTARLATRLRAQLGPVLRPPVATVVSRAVPLALPPDPRLGRVGVHLAWLWSGREPAVTWTAGGPATAADLVIRNGAVQVPVGLAEPVAAALGVHVGDRLPSGDGTQLAVTGVFRAAAPGDAAWRTVPGLLAPSTTGAGSETQTDTAALLTGDALPLARQALDGSSMTRTVVLPARAAGLRAPDAEVLPRALDRLSATPAQLGVGGEARLRSALGTVLLGARAQLRAAQAQAPVLLAGVVVTASLALLLTAQLLARRRGDQLATARSRGATLPGLALELGVESAVPTAVGGAAALLVAALLVPGPTRWGWLVPLLLVALVAGPLTGVLAAARATRTRRVPADRRARRAALRDRQLRRVAVEVVLVLLTAGAVAALRRRGVTGDAGSPGGDLLLAAAPTLALLTGAALLVRLLPPLLRAGLRRSTRSRGAVPVLAAARAASVAGGVVPGLALPVVTLALATGLVALAGTVTATVRTGQVAGSWTAVGADVTASTGADPALTATAAHLARQPGVRRALAARVAPDVQVLAGAGSARATVVVVDPAAFAALLAGTPLPDAPDLARLTGPGPAGAVRALVSDDLVVRRGAGTAVLWAGGQVEVTPVGRTPSVGAPGTPTVVLDAADVAATGAGDTGPAGDPLGAPDTVWVVGSGAARAVAAEPALDRAVTTDRATWLADRRAAPLTRGLTGLAVAAAGVLVLLAVLAAVLDAAGSAPQRRRTLATLRTLGLTLRQARAVALGELLPALLLASLGGTALGVLVARLVVGPLELRLLTGQVTEPALVVPWVVAAAVVPVALAVAAVVAAETAASRRDRLGQVLRVGG